jgi:hypothetical protein
VIDICVFVIVQFAFFVVGGDGVGGCGVGAVVVVATGVAYTVLVDASVEAIVCIVDRREGISRGQLWSRLGCNDDMGDSACLLSVELTISYSALWTESKRMF